MKGSLNMENSNVINVNKYSLASYCVEIFFNDISLSTGTCFFTKRNGLTYLVTNWHIVSGRNADTKQCLASTGAIPNRLRVFIAEDRGDGAVSYHENSYLDIPLYDDNDTPLWYQLAIESRMVDVALLPLHNVDFPHCTIEDAEKPYNDDAHYEIASEIFIIGFPFAKDTGFIPIWKKATVASEPEIDMDDMPYFYADTATKAGMSGSPVILYKDRPVIIVNEKENQISRHKTKFIGVYSGRIGANSDTRNDAQLGRIWKESVIDRILEKYNPA